jgi:hypothetical protein
MNEGHYGLRHYFLGQTNKTRDSGLQHIADPGFQTRLGEQQIVHDSTAPKNSKAFIFLLHVKQRNRRNFPFAFGALHSSYETTCPLL